MRVIDGDALVLDTGLSVRLVGIEAPAPERRNRTGELFADEAKRMLEDMALGRQVQLVYPGTTRDRYDRALAYVRTDDNLGPELWLNAEMVRLGGARIYPDTSRLGGEMIRMEAAARATQTRLWALSDWAIPDARDLPVEARGFHIMTGRLGAVGAAAIPEASCTRALSGIKVQVNFLSNAAQSCQLDGYWPTGVSVQLRGYLRDGQLEISHILNAEAVRPEDAS